ncbi:hypothetical protein ACSHWB_39965 [Lentzea sp. HUAS TT2]|uniref:hypothetical protein n=1 Tax=Lentzea sp. HUAS TT2 TaxID=3447454 RepID=UPI003F70B547
MAQDGFVEVRGANLGDNVIMRLLAVASMVSGPIAYAANDGGTVERVRLLIKGPDVPEFVIERDARYDPGPKPGNELAATVDPEDHRDFELDC